jgi:protein involved in polysaccharide export with SLBB domain
MLETKHFRVWLGVLALLCFIFPGKAWAQDQVDAPAYRIGAGDTIQIAVWMEPEYTRVLRVDADGNINLTAHHLKVLGMTAADLTNLIYDKLPHKVSNPQVTVRVTPRLSEPSTSPGARVRLR